MLIGVGRVRVKSSVRAGGLLAGVTPSVARRGGSVRVTPARGCGVAGSCGSAAGLDGGGLPVTPAGLWDLSPFYSLALGPDL